MTFQSILSRLLVVNYFKGFFYQCGASALRQHPALRSLCTAFCVSRLASEGEFANGAGLSGILPGSCLSPAYAVPGEFDRAECVPDTPAPFESNSLCASPEADAESRAEAAQSRMLPEGGSATLVKKSLKVVDN